MKESGESDRVTREQETRDAEIREEAWSPPSTLPQPHQRIGLVHRWVRTSVMGQADPVNVDASFREGWKPIDGREYPELLIAPERSSRFPDSIEVGGLLLCRASATQMAQRTEYYRKRTATQMGAVNSMLEARPPDSRYGSSAFTHETKVSFGGESRRNGAPVRP